MLTNDQKAQEGLDNVEDDQTIGMSPTEEKARAGGWKPLEEWDGDPEEWIDAKTFNRNGEYIDHIKDLSSNYKKAQKKLSKLENDFSTLAEHHAKVREIEYKKALSDLKALKKEALESLDAEKVIEIDDKIEELRESQIQDAKASREEAPTYNEAVDAWVETNSWYKSDRTLRAAANGLIQEILQQDPDRRQDVEGVLEEVTSQLKQEFPNKFGTRTRSTSATVEPDNSNKSVTNRTNYTRRLSDEERRVAKRFVEQGAVKSVEEYARQLHEIETGA